MTVELLNSDEPTPEDFLERCAFCGIMVEEPCTSAPPDTCGKALDWMLVRQTTVTPRPQS